MNPALLEILANAKEMKLVIDEITIPLRIGSQSQCAIKGDTRLPEPNLFRKHGDKWQIRYNGREVHRRKNIGLSHIHELLKQPHCLISAATLWMMYNGDSPNAKSNTQFQAEGYAELGLSLQSSHSEEILPDDARRRIQNSILVMQEELAILKEEGEGELAFATQQEIDVLKQHLEKAGFQGHQRRFSDQSQSARKRVSIAIARAIADLEKDHPALACHLDNCIYPGTNCRYAPEPGIKWIL